MVQYESEIIQFGGINSNDEIVGHTDRLSLTTNQWTIEADIPERAYFSACVCDDFIYLGPGLG